MKWSKGNRAIWDNLCRTPGHKITVRLEVLQEICLNTDGYIHLEGKRWEVAARLLCPGVHTIYLVRG